MRRYRTKWMASRRLRRNTFLRSPWLINAILSMTLPRGEGKGGGGFEGKWIWSSVERSIHPKVY